jgi:hypothetical protein
MPCQRDQSNRTVGRKFGDGGAAMLIMYRGFELVPVKDGEKWQAQVFSGSKRLAATSPFADEDAAMSEAKRIADEFRSGRFA